MVSTTGVYIENPKGKQKRVFTVKQAFLKILKFLRLEK